MTKLSKAQSSNLLILLNLFSGYTQNEDIPAFEFVDYISLAHELEDGEDDVVIKIDIELDEDELTEYGFEFEKEGSFYLIVV